MIKFLVDSAADYPSDELYQKGIALCPMSISIGEESYIEGQNLARDQFYELLETSEAFPKTSQPSPQAFAEIFEEVKKTGDELICVLISSSLSGTYQSAMIAKDIVEYENIHIIDSHTATCCIKVLADYGLQLRDEGKNAQEIVMAMEELKHKIKVVAMVDTLEYLSRGGRLSKTAATVGEIAKIKPVITLSNDGNIEVIGKCIGKIKAMNFILKHLKKSVIDTDFPIYSIYTHGIENAEKFEGKLIEQNYRLKNRLQIGATIGTHVGGGAFGLIYVEK